MEYRPLKEYIELRQGLAINKGTSHLVSDFRDNHFTLPLLRIADMMENSYTKYISKDVNTTVIAGEKDIIYTRTGQVGLVFRGFSGVVHNNSFIINVINKDIDEDYLFVVLQSEFVRTQALNLAKNSVQPDLTHDKFKSIIIPVPDINIQKQIASNILQINSKIENNNKINKELESMAKAIYDYWFLQFEFPNEEGKPYKSSGGKMVWHEELKREIPEGWKVCELRNLISIIRGVSYDKSDVLDVAKEGYVPLLKANNIQSGNIVFDSVIYVKKELVSKEQMLDKNSVFITMSSGSKHHMGKTTVIYNSIPYTYGAFCSKIIINEKYRALLSTYFRGSLFKNSIEQISIGTNINNINNEHIYGLKIPHPSRKVLEKYETIVNPILDKQGEIVKENQELVSLRDFLLPLLMNRQVGFRELALVED